MLNKTYKQGTIILVPFPFTDLSSVKLRPAVVVSKPYFTEEDLIVAFISSIIPANLRQTDILIQKTAKDFKMTGLKANSIIRCDKIATLDKKIIIGVIGAISKRRLEEIAKKLRLVLDL